MRVVVVRVKKGDEILYVKDLNRLTSPPPARPIPGPGPFCKDPEEAYFFSNLDPRKDRQLERALSCLYWTGKDGPMPHGGVYVDQAPTIVEYEMVLTPVSSIML